MIYSDAVRMGGQHVTSDICQGLQVSMQDAERLKTMHGGLVATGLDDRDMIELPSILGDWDNDRRQVSRTELIGVMRPRVEEILEEVRARLDASGFEYLPSQRIVLTGGSAQIPGLESRRGAHPRPAVPDRQAAQGSGAAAVGDRHGVLDRGRPRHARLPPAGRMLGLRDAGRPARRAPGGARAPVVQGQLVTSGRSRTNPLYMVENPNILRVLPRFCVTLVVSIGLRYRIKEEIRAGARRQRRPQQADHRWH